MAAESTPRLDPQLQTLLRGLRQRIRRYILLDGVLAALVVLAIFFWLGLLVDWGPVTLGGTEMPRSARIFGLLILGGLLVYYAMRPLIARLFRPLPDASLALLLERQHDQLKGRLITAVQLTRPRQQNDLHSEHLLDQVRQETLALVDQIEPARVLRWQPVKQKLAIVLPGLLAFVALLITSPATARLASERLFLLGDTPWPRQADLRMVGVEVPLVSAIERGTGEEVSLLEFRDNTVRIAKGGSAVLKIDAEGERAVVPDICTVYYRTESGLRGQVNMRRVGRLRDGLQSFALDGPPLSGITENISFSIRGLDDRLDDYQILAVDPPAIAKTEIRATYPPYLRDPALGDEPDLIANYQPGLRIREGTSVRIVAQVSNRVAAVQAAVSTGDSAPQLFPVEISEDGISFALTLPNVNQPTSLVIVPSDADKISPPAPYRFFLGVIVDSAPEIQFRLQGIGDRITPQVRIPGVGTISDDYGVTELKVHLARIGDDPSPFFSQSLNWNREGAFTSQVDVRDLVANSTIAALTPGEAINLFAEARDAYDLGDPHTVRSNLIRLEIVTPEELLAGLERRELELRTRLEQTISEVQTLRDSLDRVQREGWTNNQGTSALAPKNSVWQLVSVASGQDEEEPTVDRSVQLLQLRIQQAGLQAAKTADELGGIAASIDDILLEMVNNRVDTPDRSDRIASGVRDPLLKVVSGSLQDLRGQLAVLPTLAEDSKAGPPAASNAVKTTEEVLLQLTAVLEKMLDLESYNEVLDLVRDLIENQEKIIEATEKERTRSLQDLFKGVD